MGMGEKRMSAVESTVSYLTFPLLCVHFEFESVGGRELYQFHQTRPDQIRAEKGLRVTSLSPSGLFILAMEGSEIEKVFESFNLNPQLFINEIRNQVDDIIDGGFDFYQQQSLSLLGNTSEDDVNKLNECVTPIRNTIQEVLEKRLDMWEKYCFQNCFAVPEGFSLPKADMSDDKLMDHDALSDTELDSQLVSLREKLSVALKESAELEKELCATRKQSVSDNSTAEAVTELLQYYEKNSGHELFQDIVKTASELRTGMENPKTKRSVESEQSSLARISNLNEQESLMDQIDRLPLHHVDLKHIQESTTFL